MVDLVSVEQAFRALAGLPLANILVRRAVDEPPHGGVFAVGPRVSHSVFKKSLVFTFAVWPEVLAFPVA